MIYVTDEEKRELESLERDREWAKSDYNSAVEKFDEEAEKREKEISNDFEWYKDNIKNHYQNQMDSINDLLNKTIENHNDLVEKTESVIDEYNSLIEEFMKL